ncbi:MAG: hypothetical protein R3A45_11495 [Bdellovibrionota bacterium]
MHQACNNKLCTILLFLAFAIVANVSFAQNSDIYQAAKGNIDNSEIIIREKEVYETVNHDSVSKYFVADFSQDRSMDWWSIIFGHTEHEYDGAKVFVTIGQMKIDGEEVLYLNPVYQNIDEWVEHRGFTNQEKQDIIQRYHALYEDIITKHLNNNNIFGFSTKWKKVKGFILNDSNLLSDILIIRSKT